MYAELEKDFEVTWLGKPSVNKNFFRLIKLYYKLNKRKNYLYTHTLLYSRLLSKSIDKKLNQKKYDLIFAPVSSSAIAFLQTDIPIIYFTDATVASINEYYNSFSNITSRNLMEADLIEKLALEKATSVIFCTEWAKKEAKKYYSVGENKISVIPMGANLELVPDSFPPHKENKKSFNMLFIGVNWERKGGSIALETFRKLKSEGYRVELKIIGCVPKEKVDDQDITIIPIINKNNEDDMSRLSQIYKNTDILFLPTRAECFGIVFCEAMAYGIPSVSTATGGVGELIKNGVNGYTLPIDAKADEYAVVIKNLINNKELLLELKQNSREMYDATFNWGHWYQEFKKVATELMLN